MVYPLKFAKTFVKYVENIEHIPGDRLFGLLTSNPVPPAETEELAVQQALEHPINSRRLAEMVQCGSTVCIIISDLTRSWQHPSVYLPLLVAELKRGGVRDSDISFLVSTGTHRPHTPAEHALLLGPSLYGRYPITDHSATAPLIDCGTTTYGTPLYLNAHAFEADHVILTGSIVYHYLSGFSGGPKSILPGIAADTTIMANHSLALKPSPEQGRNMRCRSGNLEGNPIHGDMVEAALRLVPSFLLNVIMNETGNIGWAVAGDWQAAHKKGTELVDSLYRIPISHRADLVIASACGYPKDINLYQASKTIFNAFEALRPGGALIMLAACDEGYGSEELQTILQQYDNSSEREHALRRSFTIAKYAGYLTGTIAEQCDLHIVTTMEAAQFERTGMIASRSLDEALMRVHATHGTALSTWIMPNGADTLPQYKENKDSLYG
ncbi:lactate racemase [Pillotina sp. SPG140]|jgi:nickel-dependent lactate racemase